VFGLIIFGFLLVYNPLGSSKYRKTHPTETFLHKKGNIKRNAVMKPILMPLLKNSSFKGVDK